MHREPSRKTYGYIPGSTSQLFVSTLWSTPCSPSRPKAGCDPAVPSEPGTARRGPAPLPSHAHCPRTGSGSALRLRSRGPSGVFPVPPERRGRRVTGPGSFRGAEGGAAPPGPPGCRGDGSGARRPRGARRERVLAAVRNLHPPGAPCTGSREHSAWKGPRR